MFSLRSVGQLLSMRTAALFCAASVLAFFGARALKISLFAADLPKPKPFTAQVQEDRYRPNGERVTVTFIQARRSDGSTATVYTHTDPNGKPALAKDVYDVSAKKQISVNGLTESLSTTSLSDDQVRFQKEKETACNFSMTGSAPPGSANLKNNGESTVFLGLKVYHVPVKDRLDTWQAPDLGCYPVKVEFFTPIADGRRTEMTRQVQTVVFGEPDPSLFAVPAWPEMDPAATDAEYARRYGRRLFSDRALGVRQSLYQQRQRP